MSEQRATRTAFDELIEERWGSPQAMEANLDEHDRQARTEVVETYEADPAAFHAAWHYLCTHPIFQGSGRCDSRFPSTLSIEVVKVDPAREEITQTNADTVTRVWLEAGPTYLREEDEPAGRNQDVWRHHAPTPEDVFAQVHDVALDCGGPTFEAAVVELAGNVAAVYGHDRSLVHDVRARHARAPHLVYLPEPPAKDD